MGVTSPGTEQPIDPTVPSDDDADDLPSIAESEIPDFRQKAQVWLGANNTSDQRTIVIFAIGLVFFAVLYRTWWAGVLAGCVLLVLPFRWMAGPHFRQGNIRKGILWANLGTWYLLFPLVIIIPDTLPIAMQNIIGPMVLAATYLERRLVRQMVPATIAIAIAVSFIGLNTNGAGIDEVVPRWSYLTVLIAYVAANLWLVMGDVQELNLVHLRSLQRAVQHNRELRAADRALRESRRRLLLAADQERIRLEQDLHDGAQQQLVSLAMQLRLSAELADEGRAPTSESLMAMHQAAVEAVEEVRDLAQGVYPARLRELGLARALRAAARRSPLRITVDDTTSGELDEGTQVALYFVCMEAIQNATKHCGPDTTIAITLATENDELFMTIADDGPGFNTSEHVDSRGLSNMADRVGALDGELWIDTTPGSGTTIRAHLPAAIAELDEVSA